MDTQCSELFEDIFRSNNGGCLRICVCGRINFDSSDNGWDWDQGELEELEKNQKNNPDKYIEHDGSVGTMVVSGNEIVCGCICEHAKKSEDFILENAENIAEYLNKKAKRLKEKAERIEVINAK